MTEISEQADARVWLPKVELDDVAALAVIVGLLGICVIVWVIVGWWAGLGLLFLLLVLGGLLVLTLLLRNAPTPGLDPVVVRATMRADVENAG